MYKIKFTKECGCFARSKMENNRFFNSKEEAKKAADEMMWEIDETFCKKHIFELQESNDGFTFLVTSNKK